MKKNFFILIFSSLIVSANAYACVSGFETPKESFARSSLVFTGKVVAESCGHDEILDEDVIATDFIVHNIWKGDVPKKYTLKEYAHMKCAQGPKYFKVGEVYIVYAHPPLGKTKSQEILSAIGMCGGTRRLKNYDAVAPGNWPDGLGSPVVIYEDK